jgi:DNA-binding CsgD family transcriptional regulator
VFVLTLVAQTARIRRAGRRYSGRPVELSLLTGAQLELVRLVRRRPGLSVADAAQELGLAANTVRVADQLEQGAAR